MILLKSFIRLEILLLAGGIALALLTILGIGLLLFRPGPMPNSVTTAIVLVIPAPSTTPSPSLTPEPSFTPPPSTPPTPLPGEIGVGGYVQIVATGGDGLRLRAEPGLDKPIQFVGLEGEVFQVLAGPQESDGYTWWFLAASYDQQRRGWAVENYLAAIEKP